MVWNAECSSECPLSIEAKSPRPTAHTRHQNPRNKSRVNATPTTSAIIAKRFRARALCRHLSLSVRIHGVQWPLPMNVSVKFAPAAIGWGLSDRHLHIQRSGGHLQVRFGADCCHLTVFVKNLDLAGLFERQLCADSDLCKVRAVSRHRTFKLSAANAGSPVRSAAA